MKWLIGLLLLGLLVLDPISLKQSLAVANIKVVRAYFGLFDTNSSGKLSFKKSNRIPLVAGQLYGWIIVLKSDKSTVRLREEFRLPLAPKTWGKENTEENNTVSPDGKLHITEREVDVSKGVITNAWGVAPGDPDGTYVIRVFIEDQLLATFEFDVQQPGI